MKKFLVATAALALLTTGAFAGSSSISITAPQVTDITGIPDGSDKTTAIGDINAALTNAFALVQTDLNNNYFSKLHDLNELSKGFANSNSAAFDSATLASFQTYDLFAIMLGGNISGSLPSTDLGQLGKALNDVTTKGDVYLGVATGGFAGQVGLNAGFLVKNLYVSAKFGFVPAFTLNTTSDNGSGSVSFKQGMFGVGANYTVLPQIDLLFGFIKWRGLSFGSGLIYNSNSTSLVMALPDQPQTTSVIDFPTSINSAGIADTALTATMKDIKASLTVDNSSVVIPLEVMTSLQALWFVNVGLGVGVDMVFSGSQIKLGGKSGFAISGVDELVVQDGSATVTATDSKASGDLFVPRIAASLGLNLAVAKVEFPISFYPTTKAFAAGFNVGIVW